MKKVKRESTKRSNESVIKAAGFEITFPDLITALNLVAGVAAIFSAIKGETTIAIILVMGGMLFDYFDGKIARAYKLAHEFGREMDSLADVVTFGVAPSVILLTLYPGNSLILIAAALYTVAAAFRLARFNLIKTGTGKTYTGLPVPAAAFVMLGSTFLAPLIPYARYWLPGISLLMALLMLSTVTFPKF